MLWDVIRDRFVQYIFGGTTSSGELFVTNIGRMVSFQNGVFDDDFNASFNDLPVVNLGTDGYEFTYFTTMSEYLSTLATMITISLIVVCLFSLVVWIFKQLKHITWVV